jgi:membrane protein DedA with SNARE-associated domain
MDNLILNNLDLWRPVIYSVLFVGLLLEGEAVLFTAVYLIHQGKLDPGDTIGIAICGVLIGDSLWYFSGTAISGLPVIRKIIAKVPKDFDAFIGKRPKISIIVSKFIYGFHRPTLIRLKAVGVVYTNFLKADIPGALLWIAIVSALGYFFSSSTALLKEYFKYWEIGLAVSLIIFILISKLVSKFILKKVTKQKIS